MVEIKQLKSSAATAEMARVSGHHYIQGHSRSLSLVPVESPLRDFLLANNISYLVPFSNYRAVGLLVKL